MSYSPYNSATDDGHNEVNNNPDLFRMAREGLEAEIALEPPAEPDHEQTEELQERIKIGRAAAWTIALANHGLAEKTARKYMENTRPNGALDLEDLVLAGIEGIYEAARRYKTDGGAAFGTYAMYQVRQKIGKELDNLSTTVRLPVGRAQDIRRYDKIMREFYYEHGSYPSTSTVAAIMDSGEHSVIEIRKNRLITREMGSIDTGYSPEIDDPSDSGYGIGMESLTDLNEPKGPDNLAVNRVRVEDVRQLLKESPLNEQEKMVLALRYGEGLTLQEIGERFGLSRNRISQIESRALTRLRGPKYLTKFRSKEVIKDGKEHITGHERDEVTGLNRPTYGYTDLTVEHLDLFD